VNAVGNREFTFAKAPAGKSAVARAWGSLAIVKRETANVKEKLKC
jgi:hypothetical protein